MKTGKLNRKQYKKMKYLAHVRDGSEHKLVPGYWCVEVYAHLKKKRILPLAMDIFNIRHYETIQRLVILAMFAMGFLTWILLRNKQLTGRIFFYTSRFRKKTKFVYYRLLDGLQEFARLKQLRFGEILFEPLKNG